MDGVLRLAQIHPSRSDTWFAWFPVRYGALGTGRVAWLRRVWRNRCAGVAIYQPLPSNAGINRSEPEG